MLTGVVWAAEGIQRMLVRSDYQDPETAADYFAVYAYSASLLLTAASLLALRVVTRPVVPRTTVILVVSVACAVAGLANVLEDGLGLRAVGILYVAGVLIGAVGMMVIAATFWAGPARRLTFVPALAGAAMFMVAIGGGVLGLAAWGGFGLLLVHERSRPIESHGP